MLQIIIWLVFSNLTFESSTFSFFLFNIKRVIIKKKADKIVRGSVILKNSMGDILKYEYINKFCGFPIGVKALPTFAAKVWKIIKFKGFKFAFLPKIRLKGIKVIKATSFVTNIEEKKVKNTNVNESDMVVLHLDSKYVAILSKTLSFFNAATTIIRLKSKISTLKSMYSILGLDSNELIKARVVAITRTTSFLKNFINFSLFEIGSDKNKITTDSFLF